MDRRIAYTAFCAELAPYRQAHTMLSDALPNVLFAPPSAERTTSVIEREMREINRRTDVGVRWSVTGVANLLRLRQARRINKDDFERVWPPSGPTRATWCLLADVNERYCYQNTTQQAEPPDRQFMRG